MSIDAELKTKLNDLVQDQLDTQYYFPSTTYSILKTEFLDNVAAVADEHLSHIKKEFPQPDEIYPVYQTGPLFNDARMNEFLKYIGSTAWNILESQGFYMTEFNTVFHELWCQEHYKYSGHEEHTHGHGAQLIGFYFLETPENCSNIVLHDPRPAKKQINLPEQNVDNVTLGSNMVHFKPFPGLLFFTNAWLPHSFSRNASEKPMRFIHFTIGVQQILPNIQADPPEVI